MYIYIYVIKITYNMGSRARVRRWGSRNVDSGCKKFTNRPLSERGREIARKKPMVATRIPLATAISGKIQGTCSQKSA